MCLEILVGVVVGVVELRQVFAAELLPEPPALNAREMTNEALQAKPGRRDALLWESLRGDAGTLSSRVFRCQSKNPTKVSRSSATRGGSCRVSSAQRWA